MAIAARFSRTYEALARGEWLGLAHHADGPAWPRSSSSTSFRGSCSGGKAQAFATDRMALALAQETVGSGHHNFLPLPHRMFVLLPFMHAESATMQHESIQLHTALGDPEHLKYAREHAQVIERFGRFPRRNAAIVRTSTMDEEANIVSTQSAF